LVSELGNGATLLTNPDAPINLREVVAARTSTTFALLWDDGAFNGGAAVTVYKVSQAVGNGLFVDLYDVNVKSVTVSGLTIGTVYKYRVQS
jgi:hypothetical protein